MKKYTVYKNPSTPVYLVNERFEFFYLDGIRVDEFRQKWLELNVSNWKLPDLVCIEVRKNSKTSLRQLFEKSLKPDITSQEIKKRIDRLRSFGYNEKSIADEFGVSTKTIQRHHPKKTKLKLKAA